MRATLAAIFTVLSIFAAGTGAASERLVTASHAGLTLNGHLVIADGKKVQDGVVLLTHGTLAHNGMELIRALQAGLRERGINSLAITLSLGLDRRTGMYDCKIPHRHRHEDALDEIETWLDWLKKEGAGDVTLMGHSRGGNQTAWFAAERPNAAVKRVVLLAPSMWRAVRRDAGYERRYKIALEPILKQTAALVAAGKGGTMLNDTGFVYCPGATVSARSFVSYYKDEPRRYTPGLLAKIGVRVLVIAGSQDAVVKGVPEAVRPLADGDRITLRVIDGAGHFFLDFFADDVADAVAAFVAP
jgi:pimeloyl-ACP methyl ester carboxylesterase